MDATHRWALSVQKQLRQGFFEGSAVEVGSRGLFDEEPPLGATPASTGSNYLSSLHDSFGRYLYVNVSKSW